MTITYKGKGFIAKKCDILKIQEISFLMGTEILHFAQLGAEKIEFKSLIRIDKKLMYPDFHFCKFYFQTSNSFFSASNWPKCKISLPII